MCQEENIFQLYGMSMCVRVGRGVCVLIGYNFMESVCVCWEGCVLGGCVLGGECMCVGCVSAWRG